MNSINEPAHDDLFRLSFMSILAESYSGILIIDENARVFYANKWFEDFHNFSFEEMRGREIGEFFPNSKLKKALHGRAIVHDELDTRYGEHTVVSRYPIIENDRCWGP